MKIMINALIKSTSMLMLLCLLTGAYGQDTAGVRLAKESMALVMFSEMGNIGSRDSDFKGVFFPTANISNLVDREIVPVFAYFSKIDGNVKAADFNLLINSLKQLPSLKDGGIGVVFRAYHAQKEKYVNEYGVEKGGIAFSTMIETSLHQKRLALKDMMPVIK